jgi:hypothetical protein
MIMFLGAKRRSAREADLTAICELSRQCAILNTSQPYSPPRPVTGTALLLERPQVVQPLGSFPAFYGTLRFSTAYTRALHLYLS